jgi:hypothetical protein
MGRRVRVALALGLLLVAAAARAGAPLAERLDAALSHPGLRGARIAALVVDRDDGRVLYARDPDRALVPASNLKLLTALAALSAFGPSHRFVSEVHADAQPDAAGAVAHLYVRGGGDPALTSEDLWRLAAGRRALAPELGRGLRPRLPRAGGGAHRELRGLRGARGGRRRAGGSGARGGGSPGALPASHEPRGHGRRP